MRVILLNGPRGSGKDTIARQYYDLRIPLAPTVILRIMTKSADFIRFGAGVKERHGDDYYARQWMKEAATYFACDELIVPDVRSQNEVAAAITLVGRERVMLVQVFRQGRDWSAGEGSYCIHPDGPYYLLNNYAKENCGRALNWLVRDWRSGEKP